MKLQLSYEQAKIIKTLLDKDRRYWRFSLENNLPALERMTPYLESIDGIVDQIEEEFKKDGAE